MAKNEEPTDGTSLAWRIWKARTDAGMTQGQLAARAGLKSQSIIGMLESGQRKRTTYVVQIAEALGVAPAWLESGASPLPPDAPPPTPPEPSNVSAAGPALSPALADLVAAARPLPDADVKLLAQMARRIARTDLADKTRRLIESGGQDAGLEGLLSTQDIKQKSKSTT